MKNTQTAAGLSNGVAVDHLLQNTFSVCMDSKMSPDEAEIRQVAETVVEEILDKASQVASNKSEISGVKVTKPDNLQLGTPTIQIDLVGSRTPSPDEEPVYQVPSPSRTARMVRGYQGDSDDDDLDDKDIKLELNEKETSSSPDKKKNGEEDTQSLRKFVSEYVNDIVTKAVPIAEENLSKKVEQLELEETGTKMGRSPWYSRLRETFSRLLQTVCVCGERRDQMG